MISNLKYNIPIRVYHEICAFSERHAIDKVILFGSRAKGNFSKRSDIDLAVLGDNFDSFYWNIKEDIHSLLTFDLIDLRQNLSEELKREIEKDGIVIFEKAR